MGPFNGSVGVPNPLDETKNRGDGKEHVNLLTTKIRPISLI